MCFSVEADLAVGIGLLPVAALSLREVRTPRELPFAALPAVFAAHQLVEAVVWLGVDDQVSAGLANAAALVYALVAFPLLPFLVPLAVLLLEPHTRRLRVAPFVVLGAVVAAYLLLATLNGPVGVTEHRYALEYSIDIRYSTWVTVGYVAAVVGPSLLSGYRSIVVFGVVNLVGLTAVGLLYREAFASLWCVLAAVSSVLVWLHMRGRRQYDEPHRLHGRPLVGAGR
jgi:hypothetical protein